MKRRRSARAAGPHALRASGDRWLFGYADMVTLLFACFATLYAARLAPAAAAESAPAPVPVEHTPAPVPQPDVPDESAALREELTTLVGREGTLPGLELGASARGLVVSLPEAGSFAPGRTELSPAARRVMLGLADLLRQHPHAIRVEGHTDDVPIHTARFASNWDLSTARATTVVQLLIEEGRLDAVRLAAAGYGEHRPRVPNDTPERRARNRRVDIVVLDAAATALEPSADEDAAGIAIAPEMGAAPHPSRVP